MKRKQCIIQVLVSMGIKTYNVSLSLENIIAFCAFETCELYGDLANETILFDNFCLFFL